MCECVQIELQLIKRKTPSRNSRGSSQHDRTLGYRELNCAVCTLRTIVFNNNIVGVISDLLYNHPKKLPENLSIKDFLIRYCAVSALRSVCQSRVFFLIVECSELRPIASVEKDFDATALETATMKNITYS